MTHDSSTRVIFPPFDARGRGCHSADQTSLARVHKITKAPYHIQRFLFALHAVFIFFGKNIHNGCIFSSGKTFAASVKYITDEILMIVRIWRFAMLTANHTHDDKTNSISK